MITFRQKGDFSKTSLFMKKAKNAFGDGYLDKYGEDGVAALMSATPKDTGKTAESWKYKVEKSDGAVSLGFYNTNIQNGVPIAVVIQTGHATSNGGWIEGYDYINPAIRPIFEDILENLEKEL